MSLKLGLFPNDYNTACSVVVTTNYLTGATVMAPSIRVFAQVALLFCVVTISMGGITDWQKKYSQLENKVKISHEEIKSLHQIIQQLEKRLQILEAKGELGEIQVQPPVPALHAC